MTTQASFDAMFSGGIGKEYQMLNLICPLAVEMSRLVAEAVAVYGQQHPTCLNVLEIGGGTGITTLAILSATDNLHITSIDNEPVMQAQAKQHLQSWSEQKRLTFSADDALSALQKMPDNSVDVIASAYTLHNFLSDYRVQVIAEMYRVLKIGGQFINGDRYALDDIAAHTFEIQLEIARYFEVFKTQNRLDLLEQWIIHLFADESENHLMRESKALQQMQNAGFKKVELSHRMHVNALLTACK